MQGNIRGTLLITGHSKGAWCSKLDFSTLIWFHEDYIKNIQTLYDKPWLMQRKDSTWLWLAIHDSRLDADLKEPDLFVFEEEVPFCVETRLGDVWFNAHKPGNLHGNGRPAEAVTVRERISKGDNKLLASGNVLMHGESESIWWYAPQGKNQKYRAYSSLS